MCLALPFWVFAFVFDVFVFVPLLQLMDVDVLLPLDSVTWSRVRSHGFFQVEGTRSLASVV